MYLNVTTTTDSLEAASKLAKSAVENRLAGTAHVTGPLRAHFRHLGQAGEGEEWQVLFKTTSASYDALEEHLRREHPWEKPEVTAVEIVRGSADYLAWLETAAPGPG